MKKYFTLILAICIFWGCSSDDNDQTVPEANNEIPNKEPGPTLSDLQEETMSKLTNGGNPQVWKIESAQLATGTEVLDVSNNFNVVDDEFIFTGNVANNNLEWRRGHLVNTAASTLNETLIDYYLSPKKSPVSFVGENSSDLSSDDFDIKVDENGKVTATFNGTASAKNGVADAGKGNGGALTMTLVKKTPEDFKVPLDNLQFVEAFTIRTNAVSGYSPGVIGSYSDNSFFFVTREDTLKVKHEQGIRPERVVKFDLDDFTETEYINEDINDLDFVSKQLHIVNNKLIAIGSQKISMYNLNLTEDPVTIWYLNGLISEEFDQEIKFTRFGMAVQDDAVYIVGGAFNPGLNENGAIKETKNIYKWEIGAESVSLFATLPEARFGARATIVNDKMYVFGGTLHFSNDDNPKETIYIINMDDPTDIQTLSMGVGLNYSFVQKYENLIYVAGQTLLFEEGTKIVVGKETTLGVFNTEDNSFTTLSHNLPKPTAHHTIHQMAVFNGKMYVLYGGSDFAPIDDIYFNWPIYEASIE